MVTRLNRRKVFANHWLTLYEDQVKFSSGLVGQYAVIDRLNGVMVLALNSNREVLLIDQYRYPINQRSWEIPGGAVEKNEPSLVAGQRELQEETGLVATNWRLIGNFYPANGLMTDQCDIYLATVTDLAPHNQLTAANNRGEADEEIGQRKFFPLSQALTMIDQGKIHDAFSCYPLLLLARKHPEFLI